LFLLLALVLFIAEVFAPGIGVAAALGSVALVLAAVFSFRSDAPGLSVSLAAVIPTALVVGVAVVAAGRLALRARARPTVSGATTLLGREAVVASSAGTTGQVQLDGAWWTVRSPEDLEPGNRVHVIGIDGVQLIVEAPEKRSPT
jgi:membrane-bound serine protease (ClpP class)